MGAGCYLNRVFREGLTEKVALEQNVGRRAERKPRGYLR